MNEYKVYGKVTGLKYLATVQAESAKEAIKKVQEDEDIDLGISLCHACSHEADLDDVYYFFAESDDDAYDEERDEN